MVFPHFLHSHPNMNSIHLILPIDKISFLKTIRKNDKCDAWIWAFFFVTTRKSHGKSYFNDPIQAQIQINCSARKLKKKNRENKFPRQAANNERAREGKKKSKTQRNARILRRCRRLASSTQKPRRTPTRGECFFACVCGYFINDSKSKNIERNEWIFHFKNIILT